MFCIKCGAEMPDNSEFCMKCGANFSAVENGTAGAVPANFGAAAMTEEEERAQRKRKRKKRIFIIDLVILVVGLIIFAIVAATISSGADYIATVKTCAPFDGKYTYATVINKFWETQSWSDKKNDDGTVAVTISGTLKESGDELLINFKVTPQNDGTALIKPVSAEWNGDPTGSESDASVFVSYMFMAYEMGAEDLIGYIDQALS